ncbi:MAG TPA: flagellar filament outer layer protein FlaA, partial [Magnetospirillaceae bacterium]|nr:flagellar filament outer layer protein FlaA [Magnetospirillaceae bacterium]
IPGRRTGSGADARFEPVELPIPGRVSMIDMWIWSGNFHYFLEVFLRDYKGIVHTIPMGDLNHVGWRNFRVNVPTGIPQVKRFLPKLEGLTLVKFRIWTRPTEAVAVPAGADAPDHEKAVIFYFDQLRVLTDTYEQMFDGDALTSPEFIQRVWGSGN